MIAHLWPGEVIVKTHIVRLDTDQRLFTDLTGDAETFVAGHGDGLLSVFVPHATAGVALIETGAGSEPDLADALERLLPTQDIYRHRHGSRGHGRDHVLPAFVSPSLTVPVWAADWLLEPGRASSWSTPTGTTRSGRYGCHSSRAEWLRGRD